MCKQTGGRTLGHETSRKQAVRLQRATSYKRAVDRTDRLPGCGDSLLGHGADYFAQRQLS
jgi:hypothetical protein